MPCEGCQKQDTKINIWDTAQVERQEKMWGKSLPDRILDMYKASLNAGNIFLDLGCGFGRYLEYLEINRTEPFQYIGYDSSPAMIERIRERFPDHSSFIYLKDVTQPIRCSCDVVVASALFIHLTIPEQRKILTNILNIRPRAKFISFNINTPPEEHLQHSAIMERISRHGFRMIWQSQYETLKILMGLFRDHYNISMKSYGTDGMSARNDSFTFILELRK